MRTMRNRVLAAVAGLLLAAGAVSATAAAASADTWTAPPAPCSTHPHHC